MNYNKVLFAGNLTRDVDLRYLQSGMAAASFGVASNRRWKDAAGKLCEEATFLDFSAFGKMAETIAQHFRKGAPIFIEGRLQYRTWTDRTTNEAKHKVSCVVEGFQFVGSKVEGDKPAETTAAAPPNAARMVEPKDVAAEQDDVPF